MLIRYIDKSGFLFAAKLIQKFSLMIYSAIQTYKNQKVQLGSFYFSDLRIFFADVCGFFSHIFL